MSIISKIYGKSKITDWLIRRVLDKNLTNHLQKHDAQNEIYVIQARGNSGFFSMWFYAVGHLIYAKRAGYRCVVDWQSYPTPYTDASPVNGVSNAWEYFFAQPDGVYLSDLDGKKVYYSEDKYPYGIVPYYGVSNFKREGQPTPKMVDVINRFYQTNCPIKSEIKNEFDAIAEKLELSHCLAVHIRGTDMNFTKGHNHSAGMESIIEKIIGTLEKAHLNKIFLCTDEVAILRRMKECFGDKILHLDVYRSLDGKQGVHLETGDAGRTHHKYKLGYEVLQDAYLMAQCRAIVCGKSNVAYAAIVFNDNHFNSIKYTN